MKNSNKCGFYAGLLGSLLLLSGTAYGVPVIFNYDGACDTNCATIGLGNGDTVDGFFETDTSAFSDGRVKTAEVTDFAFTFGTFLFNSTNSNILIADLILNANQDGFIAGGISIIDPTDLNLLVAIELSDRWLVSNLQLPPDEARGQGAFSRGIVSEPGSLALMALGLIAGLGYRRARKLR